MELFFVGCEMKIYVIDFSKLKRYIKFTSFVALTLLVALTLISAINGLVVPSLYVSAAAEANGKSVIVIDAGHGGEDSGAIGADGTLEKDLNLEISLNIGELLSEKGYAVVYTRTEDKLLYKEEENIKGIRKISDLKNRCEIAKQYPEAIFVSIHMNSFGSSKYSGLQIYHNDTSGAEALANCVRNSVRESLQPENKRGLKKGKDIYVLENSLNEAILIECGFLTNPEECKKLSEKEYQNKLSFAIVYGIIKYTEMKNAN